MAYALLPEKLYKVFNWAKSVNKLQPLTNKDDTDKHNCWSQQDVSHVSEVSSKRYFLSFSTDNSGNEVSIMRNSHPGHILRKSGSFCLCSKWGERTISAGKLRALAQFSWTQPGIHWKDKKMLHRSLIQEAFVKGSNRTVCRTQSNIRCFVWVSHSRLQLLLHFSVLILGHSGFTFPQFVHLLSWALKVRLWGRWRNLWNK